MGKQAPMEGGVDERIENGQTRLMLAASGGDADAVASLLKAGADPTLTDGHGKSALHLALEASEACAQLLLDDARTPADGPADLFGRVPLHVAAARGSRLLPNLLAREVDPNAADAKGWTALHLAAGANDASLVQVLLAGGANARAVNAAGQTPFDLCESAACKQLLASALLQPDATARPA